MKLVPQEVKQAAYKSLIRVHQELASIRDVVVPLGGDGILVVMSVHNGAKSVVRTMRSVDSALHGLKYAISIADDGSVDDTVRLVRSCKTSAERVVCESFQKAPNISEAKNRAIRIALPLLSDYPWVLFMDDDDEMLPGRAEMVEYMRSKKLMFCIGDWVYCGAAGSKTIKAGWSARTIAFPPGATAVHKDLIPGSGSYWAECPEGIHEDVVTHSLLKHSGVELDTFNGSQVHVYNHSGAGISGDDEASSAMMKASIKYVTDLCGVDVGSARLGVKSSPSTDVTVVITNYKRPEHLWPCFESCINAGVPNIVISSSGEDDALSEVHSRIKKKKPDTNITSIKSDRGCNEMWLRGVRAATTGKVVILHDDDRLTGDFKMVLDGHFNDADIAHWDGAKHLDLRPMAGVYVTKPDLQSGLWPLSYLLTFLLTPDSHTISPVGGMFPKQHAIDVLEECDREFDDEYFTRPTMMVGNDIMLWLRAIEKYKTVRYTHTPLISYGHWADSESYKDAGSHAMRLVPIYNRARHHWLTHSRNIYHAVSRYPICDDGAIGRFQLASRSWDLAYSRGLVVPSYTWRSRRMSSDIKDKRQTHFLKDVLLTAMNQSERDDDLICLTNDDTITHQYWWYHAYNELLSRGAVCSFRRNLSAGQWQVPDDYPSGDVGTAHIGRDAFMFTKDWLREHFEEIPDYLLGFGDWDSTLAMLIRLAAGDIPKQRDMIAHSDLSEVPNKFVYHVDHVAKWSSDGMGANGQKHNRDLTIDFFKRRLGWEMPKLQGTW